MKYEEDFVWAVREELKNISNRMWNDFWKNFFCDVIKGHSFVTECCCFEIDKKMIHFIIDYLMDIINDLAHIYGINVTTDNQWDEAHVHLDFCTSLKFDTLIIHIMYDTITLTKPIRESICYNFILSDYKMVGQILKDYCYKLYKEKIAEGKKLEEDYKEIEKQAQGLTYKTIEIAKNSILTLYYKLNNDDIELVQENLYSYFFYKEKNIRIFHKDFMDNPSILINELNSLSSITK